jgi:hypothetical protein
MNILWMVLGLSAVILTSFYIIMTVTKRAFLLLKGKNEGPLHSNWIPLQVYSGEDSLDHPDLKKILELSELKEDERVK